MTTPSSAIGPVLFNNPSLDDERRSVMNPYEYELEVQRRREQRGRIGQALSAFVQKLHRPRQRRRAPVEAAPARSNPKGA